MRYQEKEKTKLRLPYLKKSKALLVNYDLT